MPVLAGDLMLITVVLCFVFNFSPQKQDRRERAEKQMDLVIILKGIYYSILSERESRGLNETSSPDWS